MGVGGCSKTYSLASGFVFRHVDSFFHRLDPRVKLAVSLELFIVSLLAGKVTEIIAIVLSVFLISIVAKSTRRLARTLLLTSAFALFIFLVNFVITRELINSIVYASRFVAIVASTSLFFITTSPDELEQVMKFFRLPRDFVFAFVTAVRFIPVMMLDAMQIMDAQKARGLELEKGNFLKRIKNTIPILIPLVVTSVIRSGELAEAMEARAYGATDKVTSMYEYKLKKTDKLVFLSSILLFVLAMYLFYSSKNIFLL